MKIIVFNNITVFKYFTASFSIHYLCGSNSLLYIIANIMKTHTISMNFL